MKRIVTLVAATLSVTACGMMGGSKNNTQPQAAPGNSSTPSTSAPMPGATQPMNPLDYRGGARSGAAPAGAAASLYSRLGGADAVRAVVHDFAGRITTDDRISAFFRGVDMDKFERLLGEQVCQATGGPCTYTGRPMRTAHEGMNLTEAHFNALVEDLTASLTRFNVPPRESNELLTAVAGMKGDIVGH